MAPGPRIEPGPHWWKAGAHTTAPSLLPSEQRSLVALALYNQQLFSAGRDKQATRRVVPSWLKSPNIDLASASGIIVLFKSQF